MPPFMRSSKRTFVHQALTVVATVGAFAAPARAVEPWPPSTPPGADTTSAEVKPRAPAPPPPPVVVVEPPPVAVVPPPAVVAPPPVAVAPPPVAVEPRAPAPTRASEGSDATVLRAAPLETSREAFTYGTLDGQLFLRTRRDELVLLPSAELALDALSRPTGNRGTYDAASLSRARLDVRGWVFSKAYFNLAADFASGPSLRHVDNFVAVAPWGDRVIFQAGQFDAPFTLENRTSDRYLDLVDRGAAVRAFAIPENKDQGVMVHGTNPARNFYYSAGVFNGEGPSVKGVDSRLDVMARGWVAPFSFRDPDALHDITLGGSVWTGDRSAGPVFAGQTTQAGYSVLDPSVWWTTGPMSPLVVREQGRLSAVAVELNAPFAHRFGARFEWIGKRQPFSAFDVTNAARPQLVAGLNLAGWATYAELWGWVLGDDRILGAPAAPGLELPARYRDLRDAAPRGGLMLAARLDYVDETMTPGPAAKMNGLGVSSGGATKLTALTFGATYWYTRRARLNVNYVLNRFEGTTPYLNGIESKSEQEIIIRTALAL